MKINSNPYIYNNLNHKNIERTKSEEQKDSINNTKEEVKLDKVEQIKQSIENGQYKINIKELANKMADELL